MQGNKNIQELRTQTNHKIVERLFFKQRIQKEEENNSEDKLSRFVDLLESRIELKITRLAT